MTIDYSSVLALEGLVAFPEFLFQTPPKQSPIVENPIFTGTSTGTTIAITGTIDNT